MSYTEKLVGINDELDALKGKDGEEVFDDWIEVREAMEQEEYEEAEARFKQNFYSSVEDSEIWEVCEHNLREKLLSEQLTDAEKRERKTLEAAEKLAKATARLSEAQAMQEKNNELIAYATAHNKPKMLAHHTALVPMCRAAVEYEQKQIARRRRPNLLRPPSHDLV